MARSVHDYLALVAAQHADKPNYMAMLALLAQMLVDLQNVSEGMPAAYDLNSAVGIQLDVIGQWVGLSRQLDTPITNVYFSFDTAGLGFDQGNWKGPFDPSSGLSTLDDETYRSMLRAKIGANQWDGTLNGCAAILQQIFTGTQTKALMQDNLDNSITLVLAGARPPALFLALLGAGAIPLKPVTIQFRSTQVTSVDGSPVFGFDLQNDTIAGFDAGVWATAL